MQDDSNLRQPPKNKTSSKKKSFTVIFIHLIHKAHQIPYTFTNQHRCVHLHSQCHRLPTHSHSHPPVHNVSTSVSTTAIDVQHFIKPFTVTSGKMCSYPIMIHTDWKYIYISWFINLLEPMRIHNFCPQIVLSILNTHVQDFCDVFMVLSVWVHGPFYLFLICGLVQVLFLSL
jgi:hypothetical protein